MGPTVVPLLVYGLPCIHTMYPRFWVVSEGPVSRNPPAWCHAPILTPLHPPLSLQQPPRTSTRHLPYITMPHRRFGANGTTTYTVPMTHLPLPLPSLYWPYGYQGVEGCMYPSPLMYLPCSCALIWFIWPLFEVPASSSYLIVILIQIVT